MARISRNWRREYSKEKMPQPLKAAGLISEPIGGDCRAPAEMLRGAAGKITGDAPYRRKAGALDRRRKRKEHREKQKCFSRCSFISAQNILIGRGAIFIKRKIEAKNNFTSTLHRFAYGFYCQDLRYSHNKEKCEVEGRS